MNSRVFGTSHIGSLINFYAAQNRFLLVRRPNHMAAAYLAPRIAAIYELQASLLEPRLAELKLSWAGFQLLAAAAANEGAPQAELADRLGVSPATISEAIGSQIKHGWLAREGSKGDRRAKVVKLTPEGRVVLQTVLKELKQLDKSMLQGIEDSKLKSAIETLDMAIENLNSRMDKTREMSA